MKNKNISFRVNELFFEELHKEAERRNQTLAAFIKTVLFEAVRNKKGQD